MRYVLFIYIIVVLTCGCQTGHLGRTANNNTSKENSTFISGKQLDSMHKNDSTVTLTWDFNGPMKDSNALYYLNGSYIGRFDTGFNKFIDVIKQSRTIHKIIIQVPPISTNDSRAPTDLIPFKNRHDELNELAKQKNIEISERF